MSQVSEYKVFVGSIPVSASDEDVQSYFRQFAPEARFSFERKPYKNISSGGYGFLLVSHRRELETIVSQVHYLGDRLLKCGEYFSGEVLNDYRIELSKRRILIRNVKKTITDKDIEEFFGTYGELDSAYIVKFQSSNRQRSFGYVTFKKEEPAKILLELGKVMIKEIEIFILPFLKSTVSKPALQLAQQALTAAKKAHELMIKSHMLGGKVPKQLDYFQLPWLAGLDVESYSEYIENLAAECRTSSGFSGNHPQWKTPVELFSQTGPKCPPGPKRVGLTAGLYNPNQPLSGDAANQMSPETEVAPKTIEGRTQSRKPTSKAYSRFQRVAANHTPDNLAFHFCDLEDEEVDSAQELKAPQETSKTNCDQPSPVESHKNL